MSYEELLERIQASILKAEAYGFDHTAKVLQELYMEFQTDVFLMCKRTKLEAAVAMVG